MIIYFQIGILILIAAFLIWGYFYLKYQKKNWFTDKLFKIISLVLAGIFFFRFMLGDDAIEHTFKLQGDLSPVLTVFSLLAIIFTYANILILILYPFFKLQFIKNAIRIWVFPTSLICGVLLFASTIGIVGGNAYVGNFNLGSIRALLMGIEVAIMIAYSFVVFMEEGKWKINLKDLGKTALSVFLLILCVIPGYSMSVLFGNYTKKILLLDGLETSHRIVLYIGIILPVLIYFALRNKKQETIKFALLYLSLGTLLTFAVNFKFEAFLNPTSWPIHLCNTAMYIIPICLIFKWDKLFYFTFFINVLGALLAMVMPNYGENINIFSSNFIVFFVNHYMAFFMPILLVALKVYKRPKIKQFKYSMAAFGVYFIFVLICNAWFSNYGEVDFFFINSDFIAEKLGQWAENLRNVVWAFKIGDLSFVFYPLYQFLFFLGYVAMGLGVWFVYEQAFAIADNHYEIQQRRKKIRLDNLALTVSLNGRSKTEPMNESGKNKLVLKNFTKRYGNSSVYAVKDANLTVNGGEVFGFLGPNGAGKSTIIKSIVGIQPITSGNIEVCGYDVDKQSVMAKKQIGFVPDHYALYEKLTGREYINYIADLYGVSQEERNERITKYVDLFELQGAIDNQIKTYSHGMKQKIAIMSALVHNPRIWILDEPLTGLDPNSIFQVKECMKNHAKEGNIVFFSSHIIDVVEKICDKIAIIKKGNIICTKNISDFDKGEDSLEQFYLRTIGDNNDTKPQKVEDIEIEATDEKVNKIKKPRTKKQLVKK